MCCVMGYAGHDLSAAKFKEYLLRTVMPVSYTHLTLPTNSRV